MDKIDYYEDNRHDYALDLSQFYGEIGTKPQIEQDLFRLQEKFYSTKDDNERADTWNKMYSLSFIYATSLVKQRLKNKKFLDPDVIDDHAAEASLKFMLQYVYKKNFMCGASFGEMIRPKVLETLYGFVKEDQHISLNNVISDSATDMEAFQDKLGFQSFMYGCLADKSDMWTDANAERNLIKETLYEVLEEVDREVTPMISLKLRMYLDIKLKKPKNRHACEMFFKNCCNKEELDIIQLTELEFFNRCKSAICECYN